MAQKIQKTEEENLAEQLHAIRAENNMLKRQRTGYLEYVESQAQEILRLKQLLEEVGINSERKESPPEVSSERKEGPPEISAVPLPKILDDANHRIKALMDDQELTSAQRTAAIEKEAENLQQIVEDRVWIIPCEMVDISLLEVGKEDDPGNWDVTLRIPDLEGTLATVSMSMHESKALTLKKGQQLHIQCKLWLEQISPRAPFHLSVKSASIYEGQLSAPSATAGGEVTFMGIKTETSDKKIVYVVDRSGSMTGSIDYVKYELKRSIGELGKEKEFHVIFYSSGPPVEMPTRRLVNATDRNKQLAFEFIDDIISQGKTDPSTALQRAFSVKPEIIYLLTDGEFDKANVGLVKRLNAGGQVTVHTIGFLYRMGEQVLEQIAKENGGDYKFVSEKDLATLIR